MGPAKRDGKIPGRFDGFAPEDGDTRPPQVERSLGPIDAGRNSVASANKSLLNQQALGR